jgi:hypothetical protein
VTPQRFHPLTCARRPARPTTIRIAVLVALLATPGQAMPQASATMHTRLRPLAGPGAYYVAPTGDDYANNGLTVSSPFRTIGKCASVAKAGETCLIRAGTYRETVRPAVSGSAGKPIVFAPYNNEAVTVSGADPVTGWSVYTGSIYKASVSGSVPQVFVDGQMMIQARWPNVLDPTNPNPLKPDLAVMDGGTSASTIIDSALPSLNWTGANVWTVSHFAWSSNTGSVTGYGGGRLSVSGFKDGLLEPNRGGFYYVFGTLALLDAPSEWHHDGSTLYLRTPSSDSPSSHLVEVKRRETVFDLNGRQYIKIRGLTFFAGGIEMNDASGNNLIDGITARYVAHFATHGPYRCYCRGDNGITLAGPNNSLINSDIGWSAGSLVTLNGGSHVVQNNYLHDINYSGTYGAGVLFMRSATAKILQNTFRRSGREAIQFDSTSPAYTDVEVAYNDISYYTMLVYDGGMLYSQHSNLRNLVIHHNWIHDGQLVRPTPPQGGWPISFGIYLDYPGTGSVTIHHNVFWNIPSAAMFLKAVSSKVYNNTIAAEGTKESMGVHAGTPTEAVNNIFMKPHTGGFAPFGGFSQHHNLGPNSPPDPRFVNAAGGNYRLLLGSPAINAGTPISGITDNYVGTNPDQGAYEQGGADWTAGWTPPSRRRRAQ